MCRFLMDKARCNLQRWDQLSPLMAIFIGVIFLSLAKTGMKMKLHLHYTGIHALMSTSLQCDNVLWVLSWLKCIHWSDLHQYHACMLISEIAYTSKEKTPFLQGRCWCGFFLQEFKAERIKLKHKYFSTACKYVLKYWMEKRSVKLPVQRKQNIYHVFLIHVWIYDINYEINNFLWILQEI